VTEGKKSFGRPGHVWEDNIKVDLEKVWHAVDKAGSEWAPVTYL
jgi:hypothetical protein